MRDWKTEIRRIPHPTIAAIVAVCVVVFLVTEAFFPRASFQLGATPALLRRGAEGVAEGTFNAETLKAVGTLFTALVVHAGIEHLAYNMVFLWTFGSLTSQFLGPGRALACFLVCGVCGNLLEVYLNPQSLAPVVGASGAVYGFEGIYLGLALRWELPWPEVWPLAHAVPPMQLGLFALVGVGFDLYALSQHVPRNVAYGAHLGGFCTGLLIALVVTQWYPTRHRYRSASKS